MKCSNHHHHHYDYDDAKRSGMTIRPYAIQMIECESVCVCFYYRKYKNF